MKHTTGRSVLSYLIAVTAAGLALVARAAVHPLVGDRQPFAFFSLAVIVASWYGLGAGLVALGLGFLGGDYFFVTPRVALVPTESGDLVAAVAYLVVGSSIVLLTHAVRRAEQRAEGRERSARAGEAEHEALMMNMGEGLYTVDTEGRVTFINAAAERLFGWGRGELLGRKMHDATHYRHPDGTPFPAADCAGLRVLRDGVTLADHEDVFIRRDGSFFPVVYSSSRVVSDGKVAGLVVVFRDVTRQRQTEAEREELLGVAQRARATAESAAETVRRVQRITEPMLADLPLDDLLREVLVRVQATLEADAAVILIRNFEEPEREEDQQGLRVGAVVGVEDAEIGFGVPRGHGFCGVVARERRVVVWNDVDPGQVVLPFLRRMNVRALAGVPLLSDGRLLGVLQVASERPRTFDDDDVNLLQVAGERIALGIERMARCDAERRQHESLEATNRAKDEFLAMLGHELRNPLAAVRNAVATASLDEARRPRALEIARRQADQLGRMIDDLLDVARITQGRIALKKERVRLADVIERAVESMRSFVEARGLVLAVTPAPDAVRVDADPARLEQVFVNLLSNAAKYTEPGGRIDVVAEPAEDGRVAVRVRDTGMGIAPEMLPRMWELFVQEDREIDRTQGGLGIGLTVARRLVELHGARIDARSDGIGKGAEFVVTLAVSPGVVPDVGPAAAAGPVPRGGAHVLLVEDNRDTAESLTMLLELYGHRVRTVYDGLAALDAVRAEVPEVMLVDIGLPEMDGYEVARRIRRDAGLRSVALIALTGYGREEDRRQALVAGFDHHLVKPVKPDALHELIVRLTNEEPQQRLAAP